MSKPTSGLRFVATTEREGDLVEDQQAHGRGIARPGLPRLRPTVDPGTLWVVIRRLLALSLLLATVAFGCGDDADAQSAEGLRWYDASPMMAAVRPEDRDMSLFDLGLGVGHIDVCVLGTMQVAENGDIANWSTGAPDAIPAVGGAMDLVQGVKHIYVITQHTTKTGEPKLVSRCSYPLTGPGVVSRIYTDLAVVDVTDEGFRVAELAPGVSFEEVEARTGAAILPPE